METVGPTAGFKPEPSLKGNLPRTPPYTPNPVKRRFERADSPASVKSIHPTETTSPAKRNDKNPVRGDIKVEELTEGDAGYVTDADIVYPEELEEVDSDSTEEQTSSDGDETDTGIANDFSRLGCEEGERAKFGRIRNAEHVRKRTNARLFKRSHSEAANSDTETSDPDAMADHDRLSSARRLRRRVRGPEGVKPSFNNLSTSSPERTGLAAAAEIRERQDLGSNNNNDMEVDESD